MRALRTKKISRPGRIAAFSLIEVLVALVILSVAVVGIAGSMGMSTRIAGACVQKQRASEIAENQLAIASGLKAGALAGKSGSSGNFGWSMQPMPLNDGLVRLDVQVQWSSQGRVENLALSRIVLPAQ